MNTVTPKRHKCIGCKELREDCIFAPDPYAQDINGNNTNVWECPVCRQNSADDI